MVFGTLVGVFMFSVMWSDLLMTSAISCLLWSSVYECQRVECAFPSPVRTKCGMFVMYFFYNKILTIRSELGLPGLYKCGSMTTSFSGTPLSTFMDATEIEIRNIIKLSPAKSCELDPLPTWLLKECIAELVPTITDIVNMSLRDSLMPKSLKTALIRPLLKKTGLDSDLEKLSPRI